MYKPTKCVYTHPKPRKGTAEQGEKQKKSGILTHFPHRMKIRGENEINSVVLDEVRRVRGDLGTQTHPSIPGEFSQGILSLSQGKAGAAGFGEQGLGMWVRN